MCFYVVSRQTVHIYRDQQAQMAALKAPFNSAEEEWVWAWVLTH